MTLLEITALAMEARLHANNVADDIRSAGDREAHVRLTRLAIEANLLAHNLETLRDYYANPNPNPFTPNTEDARPAPESY